ncbi:AEC family transporter [Treponema vincentii]|uniref:AEC family transporter n=1 Tax=Treponema vincentii TaxID=69710 RepID=UPI001E60B2BF|nr:AEC family transporter [Treponema vincentii]
MTYFLPLVTFNNIRKTNLNEVFDLRFVLYAAGSILVAIFLLVVIVPLFEKDKKKQGVMIQGTFRSNFVMLGIPLSSYIAGENSAVLASMLIMIIIPIFNAAAVVLLSIYGGCAVNKKKLIIDVLKNHMIIASVLGIMMSLLHPPIPHFLDKSLTDISKVGSVFPIIVLGAMLDFSKVSANFRNLLITVVGKLIGMPLIFIPLAIYLGFRANEIVALIALYGSPTAVISAVMAEQLGCDYELAAQVVIFSTVMSCITIFGIVFVLSFFKII